jgi:hypothetical protein
MPTFMLHDVSDFTTVRVSGVEDQHLDSVETGDF